VFFNVVENAIKYSPGGEVTIRLQPADEWAVVEVEDSGTGIPESALPHVFDRFFRVDPARHDSGGAGLGLSIAQAAVTAHRGTIEVRSQLATGTTVTVRLPAIDERTLKADRPPQEALLPH
jgi:signal transduction histidine kinase